VNPYAHPSREQLRIRARLLIEEAQKLLDEIDRRDGITQQAKQRRGLRVNDGGRS
jgi:hypothetical protein